MKRIFSSPDLFAINQLKDILKQAGIDCLVRNEISSGLSPEIPLSESTPELWIQNDCDLAGAEEIKRDWQLPANATENAWKCPACGELLEPQWSEIVNAWKCECESGTA